MAMQWDGYRETLDFLLFDWLDADALARRARYAEHSHETFAGVIDLCQRLAQDKFEPANRTADAQEPCLQDGRVCLPSATVEACRSYAQSGMLAAGADAAFGGMQLPCAIEMAANSFFSAASIGVRGYAMLTTANANLLLAHGTAQQRRVFAAPQIEGRWCGTMNLSEPQAGSSLSDIATRALPDGPDHASDPLGPRYRLFGQKMWISGGEHEMAENIVHLVLAKEPGPDGRLQPGTGSLSLFVVPRWRVDAQGALTGRHNDVTLAGLNHKLGYRGTVNTFLKYGEQGGALGYRVGESGQGLACMFHMMNEARIQVGLGAAMLGVAGYLVSRDYAQQRTQGRAAPAGAGARKDAGQPPVPIAAHADVKRMLLAQKAYSEGAVALCLLCAQLVDEQRTGTHAAAAQATDLLDVLTPVVKSWPSEWCLEANSLAIQVLGGYGYTREFPVEQHWRDNRLNMIHEGTHGIQGLDLLGRKLRMDGGRAHAATLARMRQGLRKAQACGGEIAALAQDMGRAIDCMEQIAGQVQGATDVSVALSHATAHLRAFGHVVLGWVWLELAVAAQAAQQAASRPPAFVAGKLACARYFITHELPLVWHWAAPLLREDRLWLELAQDAL